jgi:quercetin dioxygenase-like cupin family protein
MNTSRIDFETLTWTQAAEGLRYKSAESEGRRVRLLEFAAGYREAEPCVKSHIGYVIEGELEVEFSDRTERFGRGDALVIHAEPHSAKACVGRVLLFLVEDV